MSAYAAVLFTGSTSEASSVCGVAFKVLGTATASANPRPQAFAGSLSRVRVSAAEIANEDFNWLQYIYLFSQQSIVARYCSCLNAHPVFSG